ncbi:MAG: hypothetical protein WD738_24710 [Pirellulales bacterium]
MRIHQVRPAAIINKVSIPEMMVFGSGTADGNEEPDSVALPLPAVWRKSARSVAESAQHAQVREVVAQLDHARVRHECFHQFELLQAVQAVQMSKSGVRDPRFVQPKRFELVKVC